MKNIPGFLCVSFALILVVAARSAAAEQAPASFVFGVLSSTEGVIANNLVFDELPFLPGAVLKIGGFRIAGAAFPLVDADIEIVGSELILSDREKVRFDARLKNKVLSVTLMSDRVDLARFFGIFPDPHPLRPVSMTVTDVLLNVTGTLNRDIQINAAGFLRNALFGKYFMKEAPFSADVVVRHRAEGARLDGRLWLKDFEIVGNNSSQGILKILGAGLVFEDDPWGQYGVRVEQARLISPDMHATLLSGTYRQGRLEGNVFAKDANIAKIIDLLPEKTLFSGASGNIDQADIFFTGTADRLRLTGTLMVDFFRQERFVLRDSPGIFDVVFVKADGGRSALDGRLRLDGGLIRTPQYVVCRLDTGLFRFDGNPSDPEFDVKARSSVDNLEIDMTLRGRKSSPELFLSSSPSMPQHVLMMTLMTGRDWKSLKTIDSGQPAFSADMAVDFIDYFILGGAGSKIIHKLGFKDVSVDIDGQKRGIHLRKGLTEKVDMIYAVEQSLDQENNQIRQTVGGSLKVTDDISINAKKTLLPRNHLESYMQQEQDESEVMLEYRRKF